MSKNTVELRHGRLLEIRVDKGFNSLEDIQEQYAKLTEVFAKVTPESQVVIAADWRNAKLMSPAAADGARVILRDFNHLIDRSAILARKEAPIELLQFFRVIAESGHPERRLFTERQELIDYLREKLTRDEVIRLNRFMPA